MSTEKSIAEEILSLLGEAVPKMEVHEFAEVEPAPVVPELVGTDWEVRADGKEMKFVPFSDLAGWMPSFVPNFLVPVFRGYDNVPKLMARYVPDMKIFEWTLFAIVNKIKPLLVGPTGCGKTLLPEYIAALCGRPFLRIDNTQELEKAQVFGIVHIQPGGYTEFVPGDLPLSATTPAIVVLDELSRAPGGANMIYKRMLDRNEIYLPEMKEAGAKAIIPDEYWSVTATDNTKGDGEDMDKYPMSNVQDAAFRNAWGILLECDYLDVKEEKALIKGLAPSMPASDVTQLANLSKLLHAGFKKGDINTAFSPRQLDTICSLYNKGVALQQAIEMAYVSFVSKSELTDVRESIRAAFGTK